MSYVMLLKIFLNMMQLPYNFQATAGEICHSEAHDSTVKCQGHRVSMITL